VSFPLTLHIGDGLFGLLPNRRQSGSWPQTAFEEITLAGAMGFTSSNPIALTVNFLKARHPGAIRVE